MSSQPVIDYLTKQLFIEKNLVTYRSLSRALTIHVNAAKNELAAYHASVPYQSQTSEATYLLCGEMIVPERHSQDVGMETGTEHELDMSSLKLNEDEDEDDGEPVAQVRITLVNEKDLEEATSKYARLNSICIYSLAPAPLRDAGLICAVADEVHDADSKEGVALANIVGKIIGENIEVKPGPIRVKAKVKQAPISELAKAPESKAPTPPVKKAFSESTLGQPTKLVPIKASDKLQEKKKKIVATKSSSNFFNTRPKAPEVKKEIDDKPEKKEKYTGESGTVEEKSTTMTITEPKQEKAGKSGEYAEPKRGTKRKTIATLQTESEHDDSTSGSKPAVRVQKKRIVSDDEDMPQTFRQKTRLAEAQHEIDSEAERDLQAMMEVDDDQVIHASRNARDKYGGDPSDAEPDTEVDEAMETEMIKPKTRKQKEKKQVPVGKNGLKKRRVVKSRTMMRNGYMETEDYSSYESVDEESAPPSPATKTRVKPSKKKEKEPQVGTDEPTPAQASKPVHDIPAKPATKTTKKRTNGGQKKLANFFGPAKAKS